MSDGGQHIFISYSRQDGEFVSQLIDDLKKADINVWLDTQRMQVGTADWQRAIRTAIRGAYALVLIVSPDSADSRYVQAELDIARMYECPIYPVLAAGDDKLYGEYVPFELMRMQYEDGRGARYVKAAENLIAALNVHLPTSAAPAPPAPTEALDFTPRNPYKGLRAFTSAAEDVRDYFGREATVKELLDALRDESDGRFLAIVGPSGSGKSSVVMAGLLPQLLAGALPDSQNWTYLDPVLPGQQPLEALAVAMAGPLNSSVGIAKDDLDRSGRGLHLLGRRLAKGRDSRVVLLVDQFEELFTQTMDEDGRRHFINLLVTAATEPEGNLLVLLTLRADFYDRPLNYEGLRKLLETRTKTIGQMNLDELRAVIEEPAKLPDVRLEFEPGLVGDLLFEVREQAGALPLLQFTLDQLAEKRQGRSLTNAAYREMGGVRGALAKHAEATYGKLPSEDQRALARALFLRLIEPGETEQDTTRRRAAQSELETPDPDKTLLLHQVADAFTNARLLVTGDTSGIHTIEVSHEALIRTWERLAEWVKTAREDVRLQQVISRDAQEWVRRGKREDDLYRGAKLKDAEDWASRNLPSNNEMDFILAAIAVPTGARLQDFRVRQRDFLLEISRATTAQLDIGKVLQVILNASVTMLTGQMGIVALREETDHYTIRATMGIDATHLPELNRQMHLIPNNQNINNDFMTEFFESMASLLNDRLRQSLFLPLVIANESVGMLIIFRESVAQNSEDDRKILQSFADQAAIAVHNAQLYEHIDQERRRLAAILENSADGIMILDTDLRINGFNRAFQRITGLQLDDVLGRDVDTIITWKLLKRGDLRAALQNGWPFRLPQDALFETLYVEGDLLRRDGLTIGVSITYAPILNNDGGLGNIIANARAITDFHSKNENKTL